MLTHIDKKGNAQMVDISHKESSIRTAMASGKIRVSKSVIEQISNKKNNKGDVLNIAKIAAILATKNTSNLIPLCHQIHLDNINAEFTIHEKEKAIEVVSIISCKEKTGAEMEALTCVSVALLTIYDMCKSEDKKMNIYDIKLIKKTGGKSDFKK